MKKFFCVLTQVNFGILPQALKYPFRDIRFVQQLFEMINWKEAYDVLVGWGEGDVERKKRAKFYMRR